MEKLIKEVVKGYMTKSELRNWLRTQPKNIQDKFNEYVKLHNAFTSFQQGIIGSHELIKRIKY